MGFYAPAQLISDARRHGVEVRPISVNHSDWDCTVEMRLDGALALRLGFRQIRGLRREDADWVVAARGNGYPDIESLWRKAGLRSDALVRLAEGDTFATIGLSRRDALWAVKALPSPRQLPLFSVESENIAEPDVILPAMTLGQEVVEDFLSLRLSLRAHPLELLRRRFPDSVPSSQLRDLQGRVMVVGLVITRQRPGTASGVVFLTLEDETGSANIIVWRKVYERFRQAVIAGRLLQVTGRIQRDGAVMHIIAENIQDMSFELSTLGEKSESRKAEDILVLNFVTEGSWPIRKELPKPHIAGALHPRTQAKKLFPSRDFH